MESSELSDHFHGCQQIIFSGFLALVERTACAGRDCKPTTATTASVWLANREKEGERDSKREEETETK